MIRILCTFRIVFCGCRTYSVGNSTPAPALTKPGPGKSGAVVIPTFSYKSADNFLLRCAMTGSYPSRDGGNSYQHIKLTGGASSYALDPVDSSIFYIGSACLTRNENEGKTWQLSGVTIMANHGKS